MLYPHTLILIFAFLALYTPCCLAMDLPPAETRKQDRPKETWRYYMHGIADSYASPVSLPSLFDTSSDAHKWLVGDVPVKNPFVQHDGPALRIEGGQALTLPNPLPVDIDAVRGRRVRVFFWCKGKNTGRVNSPNSYGDPPNLRLFVEDADGQPLAKTTWVCGTVGTFPYHAYYTDVFVPEDAAAVRAHVYNRYGTAWFSKISWELVTRDNTYNNNQKQCPVTGSVASNVYYDEMNRQFRYGYWFTAHKWNYFRGPEAGLIGQRYDVASVDGLRRYYAEKVKTDNDHMNHSLMYFASRYHFGRRRDLLPAGMDEHWLAELARLVIEDQDPKSGYWGTAHTPRSMGVTFHFVDGLFAYYGYRRFDREDSYNESRHLGEGALEIPRPERIIRTTLAMQASRPDADGAVPPAGWPRHAYNVTDAPNAKRQRASLVVTMNAIDLMRRCERFVEPPLRREVYEAIRGAVGYVLQSCVRPDGLWLQSDTDTKPSTRSYMARILLASHYAERHVVQELSVPDGRVTATTTGHDGVRVVWKKPNAEENSLRLYAVDPGREPEELSEKDLVGIVHRYSGDRVIQLDPLIALKRMNDAAEKQWGRGWKRKSYIYEKMMCAAKAPRTFNAKSILVKNLGDQRLYASTCTWYGEESAPTRVLPQTQ